MDFAVPSVTTLSLFVGAAIALLLIPGPTVIYIVSRSIEHGRSAGFISVLGINTATLVHVAAAALGLSALLMSSALAFSLVKYAGAAYLIWLGLRKLFWQSSVQDVESSSRRRTPASLFREGFIVNLLNPQTALFFLAFLPQFVDVERGDVGWQIVTLGLVLIALGVVTESFYALAAGTAGHWLRRSPGYLRVERWVGGVIYVGLGTMAAFMEKQNI